ncbi:phenylacetic acid catabolic family protein [Sulfolobus islandicus Y.G.57.14]|jgi:1,2-phenylacetyl-CoA epoxidase catalytic subunit|uniref:Phenylacetic acid catabolic family protein n=2 Tax=Saccharolobus islandicus TaxID=43080 RepID=C3ND14_SACI7|nr:Phenylacetic acid catabolic protein [Sulfolobus islandicus]ACP45242.1 phenylacetic acid catabolic family protein [Sulfolobus islandicus Y.G.57.14]ACP48963.1 phenylacetic acid catabolic family protein [Sulfolobus islandicus Y.N.15.51]
MMVVVEYKKPKRVVGWGEYKGLRKFESIYDLPPEAVKVLFKLLSVQGDTEFASIEQHMPWLIHAPKLSDRVTISRIMVDEMRHGWQVIQILKEFGEEGKKIAEDLLSRRMGRHKLDAFNIPFNMWEDTLGFTFLIDRVGMFQLLAFEDSSFGPLSRIIPTMMMEEEFHINFGYTGIKKLVEEGKRDLAQALINKWFPRGLDMFGHSKSITIDLAYKYGIKKMRNDEMRQLYIKDIKELITPLGLELPDINRNRRVY